MLKIIKIGAMLTHFPVSPKAFPEGGLEAGQEPPREALCLVKKIQTKV